MARKKKADDRGIVYSTDPGFRFEETRTNQPRLAPEKQKLKVRLDTKQRGGKTVTLVEGFVGPEAELEDLGRKLKTYCGTGGSVKDWEIIIQGDQREKILQWLKKNSFGI